MLSGGAQQQLTYLAAEQKRLGRDVHVAFLHDGPKRALLEATGVTIHRLTAKGNHDPFLFARVCALVERQRPDVVQTWLLQMDTLGGAAARWKGVSWVLSERGSTQAYPRNLKMSLRAFAARRADAIVSNSQAGDRYWASRVGPSVVRRVIRNGVPFGAIQAAPVLSDEGGGLRPAQRMILYVGRFSPEKNLENLIPALGLAAARNAVRAYLCGDGTHEAEARSLVARLGLEESVRFIGYVDDVWSWMKRADVFVSVSHYEGHPNTVLEAAVCGCPLVLSDIPEHREVLKDSEAVFVERTSPMAIADAIEKVLRNPVEAKSRVEAAGAAVASLSVEAMARSYDEVYREVLKRRGAKGAR
jgi:glycosyltransferase involved in cell wall biosynthesis